MPSVSAGKMSEIAPGTLKRISGENGSSFCVANVGGRIYAVASECTHERGDLADGTLEGDVIICPLHGAMFDATSGEAVGPPADAPLSTYQVNVSGDDIKIMID